MKSQFGKLNLNDATKAVIVAGLSVGLSAGYQMIQSASSSGRLPTTPELLGALKVGAGAAAAYILKNLLTNSEDKFGKTEQK